MYSLNGGMVHSFAVISNQWPCPYLSLLCAGKKAEVFLWTFQTFTWLDCWTYLCGSSLAHSILFLFFFSSFFVSWHSLAFVCLEFVLVKYDSAWRGWEGEQWQSNLLRAPRYFWQDAQLVWRNNLLDDRNLFPPPLTSMLFSLETTWQDYPWEAWLKPGPGPWAVFPRREDVEPACVCGLHGNCMCNDHFIYFDGSHIAGCRWWWQGLWKWVASRAEPSVKVWKGGGNGIYIIKGDPLKFADFYSEVLILVYWRP